MPKKRLHRIYRYRDKAMEKFRRLKGRIEERELLEIHKAFFVRKQPSQYTTQR